MSDRPGWGGRSRPAPQERGGESRALAGGIADPDFVRLPAPDSLFRTRSERLAALAEGHPLGPYLSFLSGIAAIQHRAQETLPPPLLDQVRVAQRLAHAMPPLAKEDLAESGNLAEILDWLACHAKVPGAPEAAEQARARLAALSRPDQIALATALFEGIYPAEQLGESLYAAAALQVHLTRLAARLDASGLKPVGDGVCPVCGGPPVASVIVGWAKADRARYCCCTLCGTMWNRVRIKCTSCASTADISYFTIEGQSTDIAVEVCGACRGYIKHFHQDRNVRIEPLADDIASFALDALVQEREFRRSVVNPLMVST